MTDHLATRPPHACAVCGRVLDYVDIEGMGWIHSIASQDPNEWDHAPVPVTYEDAGQQLRPRCDFCYDDNTTHMLPALPFTHMGSVMDGNWAACAECAVLLERNEWTRLRQRSIEKYEARHGGVPDETIRMLIGTLHSKLRKHVAGAIRPI